MSVTLAIANIALDTASVSRQGFGTILFIGKHNKFPERTRSYSSLSAVAEDFATTSNTYSAAKGAFSQSIRPSVLMVGRQEVTSILTPTSPVIGVTYSVTLGTIGGNEYEYTYVAGAGDVEGDVCASLESDINGDPLINSVVIATVVGTGTDATLTIAHKVQGVGFSLTSNAELVESYVSVATETVADTLVGIEEENNSFYYITAEDHTTAFVTAMCSEVEARLKYYRFATSDTVALTAPPTGAITVPAANNYDRSSGAYHQEADTKFPEVAALAEIVFATTGTVTYSNRQVAGFAPSKNALGNDITLTEQANLRSVNGDFFARVGASDTDPSIIVVGKSGSGEWIDNIVTRDNMQVDIVADFTNFLINQKAGKVPYNNTGIAQVVGILSNTLNTYTTDGIHNFIEPDFTIEVADISDISDADKAAGVFKQLTFVATLTGAINTVEITGTLTL